VLIQKSIYPTFKEDKSKLMLKAEASLTKDLDSFILHPPELRFLLQCAWIVGFKEKQGEKNEHKR